MQLTYLFLVIPFLAHSMDRESIQGPLYNEYGQNLLFATMLNSYEQDLIPFYKNNGATKAASSVLEGLAPHEVIELISHKNIGGRSAIDMLKCKEDNGSKDLLAHLQNELDKAHQTLEINRNTFYRQMIAIASLAAVHKQNDVDL